MIMAKASSSCILIRQIMQFFDQQVAVTLEIKFCFAIVIVCLCQYYTIQYNTIQYNTMQCNAMQCNAIQYNTIQYNAMQYNSLFTIEYLPSNLWQKIWPVGTTKLLFQIQIRRQYDLHPVFSFYSLFHHSDLWTKPYRYSGAISVEICVTIHTLNLIDTWFFDHKFVVHDSTMWWVWHDWWWCQSGRNFQIQFLERCL